MIDRLPHLLAGLALLAALALLASPSAAPARDEPRPPTEMRQASPPLFTPLDARCCQAVHVTLLPDGYRAECEDRRGI